MNKKVAILINSCDLYEDAWDPFFSLFKIQWPDCPYDIYLNTENADYTCGCMNVRTVKTGSDLPWTARIKKALSDIDTDYILFMLEDFFLLDRVNVDGFNAVISQMEKESDTGFVFFTPIGVGYDIEYKSGTVFTDVSRFADYRVNACMGLWKKEFLLQMLYIDGSPWEFEHNATRLSWMSKYRCCVINPEYASVFSYSILISEGYGITQRKWLPKNKELFAKYNISVDFSNLGILQSKTAPSSAKQGTRKRKSKLKNLLSPITRRIRKYKKRLKKLFRYASDTLFIKSKFNYYCNSIKK